MAKKRLKTPCLDFIMFESLPVFKLTLALKFYQKNTSKAVKRNRQEEKD